MFDEYQRIMSVEMNRYCFDEDDEDEDEDEDVGNIFLGNIVAGFQGFQGERRFRVIGFEKFVAKTFGSQEF